MKLQPFPLPISYGQTDAVKNSGGYLINMEAEKAPDDAKTPVTLLGSPGLKLFCDTGIDPVLSKIEINNADYAVTKTAVYRIFPDGGFYRFGTVALETLNSIATNGIHIVVTDGKRIFAYTIQADEQSRYDNQTPYVDFVTELTNAPNYYPASTVTFLDQMFVFGRDDTNQFYNTGLLNLTVNSAAFTSAESNPDNTVAVIENQQQIIVVGRRTFEVFYNSGTGESPFVRVQGAVGDHGSISPYTVKRLRNSVFWLDQNGTVVQLVGYQPRPISTHAIEEAIKIGDLATAFAFTYSDDGHDYYQLTVGELTFVFDLATGLWHQRQDYTYGRHRANCHSLAYSRNLVGSFVDGKIYEMSRDYYDNAGDPLVAVLVPTALDSAFQMVSHSSVELDIDVGFATPACPDPVIGMEISNDDGETWGVQRLVALGKVGQKARRVRWQRNGQARQRRYRFTISDPVPRRLTSKMWLGTR